MKILTSAAATLTGTLKTLLDLSTATTYKVPSGKKLKLVGMLFKSGASVAWSNFISGAPTANSNTSEEIAIQFVDYALTNDKTYMPLDYKEINENLYVGIRSTGSQSASSPFIVIGVET